MTIEQHSGFNPEAHIQELDGEILPYVEPLDPPDYLNDLPMPTDVTSGQIARDNNVPDMDDAASLPPEVQQAIAVADAKAKEYKHKGYRPKRVEDLAGKGRSLALLAARGIDIRGALPPEPDTIGQTDSITLAQERQIDHLMDTTGLSYDDAKRKVL